MARSSRKVFFQSDKAIALEKLKTGRTGAVIVCTNTKPFGPEYKLAIAVTDAIDALVKEIDGIDEITFSH